MKRKAALIVCLIAIVLLAGCTSGTENPEADPGEKIREYWGYLDDGDYRAAREMALGDSLFDEGVFDRGQDEPAETFGPAGENLSLEEVEIERAISAEEGSRHLEQFAADSGYLVQYRLIGTLRREGPRGPFEQEVNATTTSLVLRKEGAWKVVPDL